MAETRKIAAILVADVVGYSRLTGADEDRTLARLRGLRSDLIDPAIAAHHGRVIEGPSAGRRQVSTGDRRGSRAVGWRARGASGHRDHLCPFRYAQCAGDRRRGARHRGPRSTAFELRRPL